jgi:hypothetical protein
VSLEPLGLRRISMPALVKTARLRLGGTDSWAGARSVGGLPQQQATIDIARDNAASVGRDRNCLNGRFVAV